MTSKTPIDLGIAGLEVQRPIHIAHFYYGPTQMMEVLGPYVRAGLRAGDLVALVVAPDEERAALEELGAEGRAALASGQMQTTNGASTPEGMADLVRRWTAARAAGGWARFRMAADASFARRVGLEPLELVRWEAMSDGNVHETEDVAVLCQYDLTAFSGTVIMDALKTHPLCVTGGVLQTNAHHIQSAAFLEELAARPA